MSSTARKKDLAAEITRHARAIVLNESGEMTSTDHAQAIIDAMHDYDRWMNHEGDRIATRAAEAAAREIEDSAFAYSEGNERDSRLEGALRVLDELERTGATDEIAGVTPADDVCRRLRRESGTW